MSNHAADELEQTETVAARADRRPAIRTIGTADLREALKRGFDDFMQKPSHLVFLGVIYPVVGLILARAIFGYNVLPLLYPLMAGFALIGPFAALGLYEISRRREQGEEVTWRQAFGVFRSAGVGSILALGAGLLAIFLLWLGSANAIYQALFPGADHRTIADFLREVLTTPAGWALIVIGNGVGLLFAVVVLAISVVSFPLILDRHVDAATAVTTSVRAVVRNPKPMVLWGIIVAVALAVGSLPFFVGLAVVVPVLGHATWHLYRRVVTP